MEQRATNTEKNPMRKKSIGFALSSMFSALCLVGALLSALWVSAEAQQPAKLLRIGYLDPSTSSGNTLLLEAFRQEMNKLGWIEGTNVAVEYRFAEQRPERLAELAANLVDLKVDVPAGLAAKKATTTIPIVMTGSGDAVGTGLVASLARPGGNVTGLSTLGRQLITKRLEILKDVVPRLTRAGVMWSGQATVSQKLQLKETRAAAMALEVKLEEIEIELDTKGLETAFQTAIQKRVNAITTTSARLIFVERKRLVEFATKYRLPAVYFEKGFVDVGGLMSYGSDYADLYRRAAIFVDKILKGAKPAELPVEQPTKFELIINLKAAKQIGLTIPPNVLARADKVIR